MCGILGVATTAGRSLGLDDRHIVRMRDELAHRGPDGVGLWRDGHVALAHMRLAVIDPSEGGAQPMTSDPDPATGKPRFILVYNGELYNDQEVRRELESRGERFTSTCDTETVLRAWAMWGPDSLHRLRGMFAFAIYDAQLETMTLVRDPLGIKPLYWWTDGTQIVFASEPRAILAHPDVSASPNMRMVGAYLTTIRTVLGRETMFDGIRALPPGSMLRCDLGCGCATRLVTDESTWWRGPAASDEAIGIEQAGRRLRDVLEDSVKRHLRSDVPMCSLLSGGLDSSAIVAIAKEHMPGLRSFCAGASNEGTSDDDLSIAREVAAVLGTQHHEAIVTRELFTQRWGWMVEQMGVPLSTPNEVAIYEVARTLRDDGCVVTLSGEGADELLAGYETPMDASAQFLARGGGVEAGGLFELAASAWVAPDLKPAIVRESAWRDMDEDRWLGQWYSDEFGRSSKEARSDGLDAHLRFHRRVNLTGLLGRLDSATMLASVEGRTPFADSEVAKLCESLPMSVKYAQAPGGAAELCDGAVATAQAARTKMVLRRAFAGALPQIVIERPKASFPLPFQGWMSDQLGVLERSSFAKEIFRAEGIAAVRADPEKLWHAAWPMLNVALWGERWGW